jgi:hypothetical protein
MVATVVVVMVVVMVFFTVIAIDAMVHKQRAANRTNALVARADVLIAQADVQTVTVVVAPSSLKKQLLQKQLLKKLRRIRRRKLLQLQLKPNFGFTQNV